MVLLLLNSLLRRYVIQPVSVMGGLAQKISADEMVAEVTETEFFRDLQAKAKTLRRQRQRKADEEETDQDDPPQQE